MASKTHAPQANVRLTTEEDDILRALTFLEGGSASEVLRPIVTGYLTSRAEEPAVAEAVAALRKHRGGNAETVLASIQDRLKRQEGA